MREKQERLTHKMIARRTRDCSKEKRDTRGTGRRSEAETQGSRKSKLLWERGGTVKRRSSWKQLLRKRNLCRRRSSEEEHMENALASGAEEGRDKLR